VLLEQFRFTNLADRAVSDAGWVVNSGVTVDALAGDDTIKGAGDGILILGTLNTGDGDDTIKASTTDFTGLDIYGKINTGKGNDTIIGIGFCRGSTCGAGIDNRGIIRTGAGDDTIRGSSMANSGTIKTNAGNDVVDFLTGGFRGIGDPDFDGPIGKIHLGSGNDTLKGFGTGSFHGGKGVDKIIFGEGTYEIIGTSINSDKRLSEVYLGGGKYEYSYVFKSMNVNGFEQIGGANGGLFDFKDGIFTVDSNGVGTFA